MLPNILFNWWAAFRQIALPPSVCPASPEGQQQVAGAVVAAADWHGLFFISFVIAAALPVIAVFWAYNTRTMGAAFARRWRWTALWTAVIATVVCLVVLLVAHVQTFGCEYGERMTTIPLVPALLRSTVAFAQALLFFFIWSVLLTRFARLTRRQPWYDHSRYPV